jgi:hypothetical protein
MTMVSAAAAAHSAPERLLGVALSAIVDPGVICGHPALSLPPARHFLQGYYGH